jgi:hypothetical protein
MNAAERAPYLEAGDAVLLPLGFKRRKKDYEWRRVVGRDTESLHLNFGLGVINPSYGVSYTDLDALFPAELGVRCGPWCMLQSLTATSYSMDETPPARVTHDLLLAVAEFPALRDRPAFADLLMAEKLPPKFVNLFSARIRMLPVLLATLGRPTEAHAWLTRFEAEAPGRDQQLPRYAVFAAQFRATFQP